MNTILVVGRFDDAVFTVRAGVLVSFFILPKVFFPPHFSCSRPLPPDFSTGIRLSIEGIVNVTFSLTNVYRFIKEPGGKSKKVGLPGPNSG